MDDVSVVGACSFVVAVVTLLVKSAQATACNARTQLAAKCAKQDTSSKAASAVSALPGRLRSVCLVATPMNCPSSPSFKQVDTSKHDVDQAVAHSKEHKKAADHDQGDGHAHAHEKALDVKEHNH